MKGDKGERRERRAEGVGREKRGREKGERKERRQRNQEKGEGKEERKERGESRASDVGACGTSSRPPRLGKPQGTDLVVAGAPVCSQPWHQRGDVVDALEKTFHHVTEAIGGARVQGRVKHQIWDHQIQLHLKQGREPCLGVW